MKEISIRRDKPLFPGDPFIRTSLNAIIEGPFTDIILGIDIPSEYFPV